MNALFTAETQRSRRLRREELKLRHTARGFYNEDKGTNYGQARYLCYYLQQRGLLVKFYREFYAHQKEDPTGYQSLQKILGVADMNAFKQIWEKYVLSLSVGYEITVRPS